MLLTLSPLPPDLGLEATPAQLGNIAQARALLLPPDTLPVADITGQPERWEQLKLMQRAHAAGLPILAWGNGAALLGRMLGAQVVTGRVAGAWQWRGEALWPAQSLRYAGEYCPQVRGMETLATAQGISALWRVADNLALIDPQPSAAQLATLLSRLPEPLRRPATPLEALGGPNKLSAVLHDFYAQCRADPVLGPTFAQVTNWPEHMQGVQRFWETMLGEPERLGAWRGNLNHIHAPLRVTGAQLERWLELLEVSAQRHLSPQGADSLLSRARAMRGRLSRPRG